MLLSLQQKALPELILALQQLHLNLQLLFLVAQGRPLPSFFSIFWSF